MQHGTLNGDPVHLKYFDVSEAGFAWRDPVPQQILTRRIAMNDKFIFDVLLAVGNIDRPMMLFPPRNLEDLEILLHCIELSDYDDLKKECLIYYLLKWHNDGREKRFQVERSIPSQFANLAEAYWHLDTGHDVARAVSILSDRRLNTDYTTKILHAISISPNSSPLIVQYVRTAKPRLNNQVDTWTYMLALADLSLLEAWQFQRTYNETTEMRKVLLDKLLERCVSPTPRPDAITTLLSLPLSSFEEEFLHRYALSPPNDISQPAIPLLRELVCVRLIQSGKYAEAVKIDHKFASSTLNESKSEAESRRKMVLELYESLPLPERTLLDAELEGPILSKPTAPAVNGLPKPKPVSPVKDLDLSQSWEEIPRPSRPPPVANGFTPSRTPVPATTSLFGLSTSTNGAPPIIPISTGTPTITINRPRPSFPLSSSLSSSKSRQQFPTIPVINTSGSGSRLQPSASQLSASTSFSPASRQANAFYKPPPVKPQQGVKRSFESTLSIEIDEEEELGAAEKDTKKGADSSDHEEQQQQPHASLDFSLFGNAAKPTSTRRQAAPPPPSEFSQMSQSVRRAPPGAFVSDDDDDDEPAAKEPSPPPPTRARISARTSRAQAHTSHAPVPKRARPNPKSKPRQSVPGALIISGDEDDEDEEDDQVAPLPSPPRRGATRRVRETTPSSDVGDEEGGQTRRRSSRLSTTGAESTKKESSSKAASTAGKAKKSTKSTATKKKR